MKISDIVRISKYKNVFAKGYTPNWSKDVFMIKNFKNSVPWIYVINDVNGEEIVRKCYENEWQKTNQIRHRTEKLIRRKGDKLYF